MNILYRRDQAVGRLGRPVFKLWAKLERDEEEQALIDTYHFNHALLIEVKQEHLMRYSIAMGLVGYFVLGGTLVTMLGIDYKIGAIIAAFIGIACGYAWYNEKRETIYVNDLLLGRHFRCRSIIDLAKKEADLENVVSCLRQVLESAKHWDGTESRPVIVLPPEEARQFILKLA